VNKYVLILLFIVTSLNAFSQKKSIVNLVSSKNSTGIKLNGKDVIKVYSGTFKQDYSTLTSDSAYFYPQDNAFDAFGNVNINQGDTLNIYGDKLNYNGNTKTAILTNNVRMVDKDATLTTNHLIYNTATRIGTYTDGGKLVNKDNTLISKNGYYFAYSRDSYFRYDVSLTTPDALVKTDTMRYNTGTRISYFYGPTNIYGTKGEKDKDTLYTENGNYNTVVEQAAFGKKNFYRSGTRSLKGDSLFYDKINGYGRAVKHVTFTDREQKVTIKGDLGTYFKADERTVVTQDPYIVLVTEQKDSTKTDSLAKADSLNKKAGLIKKEISKIQLPVKNTIPIKSGITGVNKNDIQAAKDSVLKTLPGNITIAKIKDQIKKDSVLNKSKLPIIKAPELTKVNHTTTGQKKKAKPNSANKPKVAKTDSVKLLAGFKTLKDTSKIKTDSVYMSADTIETWILPYKDLKIYQEKQRLAHIMDTSSKPKKVKKKDEKEGKFLTATYVTVIGFDTSFYHREYFGKPKAVAIKKKAVKPPSKKQLAQDSIVKKQQADSAAMAKLTEPKDTARIRVIIAHHHAKLFKTDLQSKADSMFYSNADSTIRCFVNPIIWTEGSQLSGDTVLLQMKHKKLDNLTMFPNALIVNIEKGDSINFNQVAGKRVRGYFKDDKLDRMFIEGNAESIYFNRDSGKTTVSGMQRSLSSRIRINFKDSKATALAFLTKPENKYTPVAKIKEDDKILKGFLWKPKERPISKESIIPSYYNKKPVDNKAAVSKGKTKGKVPIAIPGANKMVKDSTIKTDTVKVVPVKVVKPFKVITVY